VRDIPGGGAAGGLAGGLAAVGATLVPGFDVVAESLDLVGRMEGTDLIVTGEGYLDDQSFNGKAVGGMVALAGETGVPVLVIAGDADPDQPVPVVSLVERFGEEKAMSDTLACIETVVAEHLRQA
jgi:glycerate kinase